MFYHKWKSKLKMLSVFTNWMDKIDFVKKSKFRHRHIAVRMNMSDSLFSLKLKFQSYSEDLYYTIGVTRHYFKSLCVYFRC